MPKLAPVKTVAPVACYTELRRNRRIRVELEFATAYEAAIAFDDVTEAARVTGAVTLTVRGMSKMVPMLTPWQRLWVMMSKRGG